MKFFVIFFSILFYTFSYISSTFTVPKCIESSILGQCELCLHPYFNSEYFINGRVSKFTFPASFCLEKLPFENVRKIFIQNKETENQNLTIYDKVYSEFGMALEEESKIAIRFAQSEISFFFQNGTHFLTKNDFYFEDTELFRHSQVVFNLQPLNGKEPISLIFKTNRFFLFISKRFYVYNINFYGNDLLMKDSNPECNSNTPKVCCTLKNTFFQQNHECYYDNNNSITNFETKGLFNLEYMPETIELPELHLRKSNFYGFLRLKSEKGFNVIFNSLVGILFLENLNFEMSYFSSSLIQSSLEIDNLAKIYVNFFNFSKLSRTITLNNIVFNDLEFEGSELIIIKNGIINLKMNNLLFLNINNSVLLNNEEADIDVYFSIEEIQIFNCNNITIAISQKEDASKAILFDRIFLININNNVVLFNFQKCIITMKNTFLYNFSSFNDPSLFFFKNSFTEIQNVTLLNSKIICFAYQIFSNIIISESNFIHINYHDIFFLIQNSEFILIQNTIFEFTYGSLAIFYFSNSQNFTLYQSIIKSSNIGHVFFFERSITFISYSSLFYQNSLITLFETFIFFNQIKFYLTIIKNNFFTNYLFRNTDISMIFLSFDTSTLEENKFNGISIIFMLAGNANFTKFYAIQNFFVNSEIYQYAFNFEIESKISFLESYLEDCGIFQKKIKYSSSLMNSFFYLWYIRFISFEKILLIVTKKIELAGGFISSSPMGNYIKILSCNFIIISKDPSFEYKGIILDSPNFAFFKNNSFYNLGCSNRSFAHKNGAVFISSSSSYKYSANKNIIHIVDCFFYNCSCINGGGLALISMSKIEIHNIVFYNAFSFKKGGALLIFSNSIFLAYDVFISESSSENGGAIYLKDSLEVVFFNLSLKSCLSKEKGILYIDFVKNLTIFKGIIEDIVVFSYGGIYLNMAKFYFEGILFNNTIAYEGGVLYIQGLSNFSLNNISIYNTIANKGGAFYGANINEGIFRRCNIFNSNAYYGSAFAFENFQSIIIDTIFVNNSISFKYGIIFSDCQKDTSLISLFNNTFTSCFAEIGSIISHFSPTKLEIFDIFAEDIGNTPFFLQSLYSIVVNMKNVNIIRATLKSNLILASGITLSIQNFKLLFTFCESNLILIKNCLFLIYESEFLGNDAPYFLTFEESNYEIMNFFINNTKLMNYTLFISYESEGNINNLKSISVLYSLQSDNFLFKFNGGYHNLTQITVLNYKGILSMLNSCYFFLNYLYIYINNFEMGTSQIIIFENSEYIHYSLVISHIYSENFVLQEPLFRFSGLLNVSLSDSFVLDKSNLNNCAIIITILYKIQISNFFFINFKNRALFLSQSSISNPSESTISNCFFLFNEGPFGGAVFISNVKQISFLNCFFFNNSAISKSKSLHEGIGGSIYVHMDLNEFNTHLILSLNQFKRNFASKYISCIFSMIEIIDKDSNIFEDNSDDFYFSIFSYPFSMLETYPQKKEDIFVIKSGNPFELKFEIREFFGEKVLFDNFSLFSLKPSSKNKEQIRMEDYFVKSEKGSINFENIVIKSSSNLNFSLLLVGYFDSFNTGKSNYYHEKEYHFFANHCTFGEIITLNFSCLKCSLGFFSLIDPMKTEQDLQFCKICPPNAECLGGNIINPFPGYYRSSISSEFVHECFVKESCLGLVNATYEQDEKKFGRLKGGCEKGNKGTLCFLCELGYGKNEKSKPCQNCQSYMSSDYVRFALVSLAIFGIIISNAFAAERYHENLNKINISYETLNKFFVNHSQQVSIIVLSTKISLGSNFLEDFFDYIEYFSFSNPLAFVNDCLLQIFYYSEEYLFLIKFIIVIVLPVVFSILSLMIWFLIQFIFSLSAPLKKYKKMLPKNCLQLLQKFSLFFLLSAYLFYAMILKTSFSIYDCFKLGDTKTYMKVNPDFECWKQNHLKYVIASLPGIIIWGLFFPFLLFFILKKNDQLYKKHSKNDSAIQKSGCLLTKRDEDKENDGPEKTENKISGRNPKQTKVFFTFKKENDTKVWITKVSRASELAKQSQHFVFFYKDFVDSFHYWESTIFMRKFVITLLYSLNEVIDEELKFIFMYVYIVGSIYVTTNCRPYKLKLGNKLEITSLILICFVVIANFSSGTRLNETSKLFIFVFVLFANGIFYGIILFLISKTAKKNLKDLQKSKLFTRKFF